MIWMDFQMAEGSLESERGHCHHILQAQSLQYPPTALVPYPASVVQGTTPAAAGQDYLKEPHLFRLRSRGGERGDTAMPLLGTHIHLPRP